VAEVAVTPPTSTTGPTSAPVDPSPVPDAASGGSTVVAPGDPIVDPPPAAAPRTTAGPPISTSTPPTTEAGAPVTSPPTTTPTTSDPHNWAILDCGSSTPSGWPTTTAASPAASACLVDAFNRGQRATLVVVTYETGPERRTEHHYEITGLQTVHVTSTNNFGDPATDQVCHGLTDVWSTDSSLVRVSDCT
jgi:hypothetical protein